MNARDNAAPPNAGAAPLASEADFRELANTLPNGAWVIEADGESNISMNTWMRDNLRINPDRTRSEILKEITHPDDLPGQREEWKRAVATGTPYQIQVRFLHRDGAYHWFLSRAVPLKDERGIVRRWVGSSTDIDEQKRAEQVLRESGERYRQLVESIPVPTWTASPEGKGIYCNRCWREYTGQTPEEFAGFGWIKMVHPEDVPQTLAQIERATRDKDIFRAEYRLLGRDGVYRWHTTRGFAERNARGEILGWVGATSDSHSQKMAREELERLVSERTAELRQSEARLRQIIDLVPHIVFVKDWDGRFLLVNKACADAYGISVGEMTGQVHARLHARESELKRMRRDDREVMRTGKTKFIAAESFHGATGSMRFLQTVKVPFLTGENDTKAVLGVAVDVTEQKRLEREVAEISELERQYFGQELHDDICQRLASLVFMTETLLRRLKREGSAHAEQCQFISGELRKTLADTRELSTGLHPLKLNSRDFFSTLRTLAGTTNHRLPCRFECGRFKMNVDSDVLLQLYRIAQEAVSNALKHSNATHIVIELRKRRDRFILAVRDDGTGLPAKVPAGLGMRTMNNRARNIGATLEMPSQPGKGTAIICELPIRVRP